MMMCKVRYSLSNFISRWWRRLKQIGPQIECLRANREENRYEGKNTSIPAAAHQRVPRNNHKAKASLLLGAEVSFSGGWGWACTYSAVLSLGRIRLSNPYHGSCAAFTETLLEDSRSWSGILANNFSSLRKAMSHKSCNKFESLIRPRDRTQNRKINTRNPFLICCASLWFTMKKTNSGMAVVSDHGCRWSWHWSTDRSEPCARSCKDCRKGPGEFFIKTGTIHFAC